MDKGQGQQNWLTEYNSFFVSVSDKSLKLSTALYMVTDSLEDDEPIKFETRKLALDFIETTKILAHISSIERGFAIDDSLFVLDHIISLINLAGSVSLISSMNSNILINEFRKVRELLAGEKERAFTLRPDGLKNRQFTLSEEILGPELTKEISDTFLNAGETTTGEMSFIKKDMSFKNSPLNKTLETQVNKTTRTHKFDIAVKKTRRDTILKIIKDKKEVMIKDITSLISDCSEKTIQRELTSLVSLGVLKKMGNKRWSRYSLA